MIATGLERFDPESDYVSDVFTGLRKDGTERNMAVDYARHAVELYQMSESEMAKRFNLHLTRATRYMPNRREAAQKLIQMHKRHGEVVYNVLKHQLEQNAASFIDGSIYESSMISVVGGLQHLESSWKRYANRISNLLSASLPTMCKTHKPEDEPHLQELCDGVLKAHDEDLVREYPFMRWGAVSTKPDWSNEELCLWVEMKYVRKKEDIRPITEDIAADITKYGDNHRRVLYTVYDPIHLIVDERAFSAPIVQHKEMLVHFVR